MPSLSDSHLSEVEEILKRNYVEKGHSPDRLQSTALQPSTAHRVAQLTLPDDQRNKMPLTKDKYLVRENETLVLWERETRKFLRKLSPEHGHRVSAAMVYEWATGILVADLVAAGGSTADLRKINQILRYYFGKPGMTHICGRKVPNAYRVPVGYFITRHRPMTLTLYAEYLAKTLNP